MKNKGSKNIAKERLTKTIKRDRAITRSSRKIARSLYLTGLFGIIAFTTSCSGIIASRDAIEALNRGSIGIIEQTKATPDMKTAYFENENIIANQRGGLLSKLFGRSPKQAVKGGK